MRGPPGAINSTPAAGLPPSEKNAPASLRWSTAWRLAWTSITVSAALTAWSPAVLHEILCPGHVAWGQNLHRGDRSNGKLRHRSAACLSCACACSPDSDRTRNRRGRGELCNRPLRRGGGTSCWRASPVDQNGERRAHCKTVLAAAGRAAVLDFEVAARREGGRVLRSYFDADFYRRHGPDAGETMIDALITETLAVVDRVTAFMAN